jgi:VanZ family protein
MLSILYGIVIEILQETTTTTRNADILDVLANFTGTLSALAVFILLKKKKQTNFRY